MQNTMKRLLCLVMTVIMVLSMVPAVFATDTAAAALAINASTGAQYEDLTDALLEAAEGQTVRLQQDVQDVITTVLEGVTLDLNGYTLTTNYMTAFGDLVDSSADNAGLLQVADSRFMLQQSNSQLPVKTAEGYRFAQLGGFNTAMPTASKYVFQPLFEAAAHEALAQGSAATGISVEVFVTWKQGDGTRAQRFVFNDSHLSGFLGSYKPATGKYSKQFALTLMGAENFEELTFAARIVSQTGVVFDVNSEVSQPESDFTVDEDNKLVGDMTLESAHGEALVADGTQLEKGAKSLQLKTTAMDETTSDVEVDNDQQLTSLDVHVDGIAKENTVPVIVTLNELAPEFLNKGNISLFHVENGETVEMTRVYSLEELDAHNEYYYDIITGTVKVAIASFSEIVVRSAKENSWNGQVDTAWYNTKDTSFTIYNADQLAGLGYLVDNGNTFDGKTIELGFDIDLYGKYSEAERGDKEEYRSFNPIGYGYNVVFKGTFDGNGHTIRNLFQHGWDMGLSYSTAAGGLFASVVDASFYDLTIENAYVVMECIDMGALVGYAYGDCHFENINVKGSTIANYNRYTGGVVGEVNGNHTFINVDVDDKTVVSALWGTFDPSCGGIIGGKWGDATVYMENCDVACVLDVYNDVTSAYRWYSYRRCGMLIGYTEESRTINGRTEATASFLTTVNCTVQYGDWANYTYCEFGAEYYPYVRVQAGLFNGACSNARYGNPVGADGNKVSDPNHEFYPAHNEGEDHDMSVVFHQLYGGGQGCYGGNQHVDEKLGVTELTNVTYEKKFAVKENNIVVKAGQTYTLGELFTATGAGQAIQNLSVNAYVSAANIEDVGKISGSFTRENAWAESTIKFTGMGKATLTLDDYYYCDPVVLTVYIAPEFTVTTQRQYINAEEGQTQYALYLTAKQPVVLGDYSYTVNGKAVSVAYDSAAQIVADDHPMYIGAISLTAGETVEGVLGNIAINGVFDGFQAAGVVTLKEGYTHTHNQDGWTAWNSSTTLPTTSGKYYLTKNVTLSTQAAFDNADISLCLNGYTITNTCTNTSAYRDRAYSVNNNGILSICDCTAHLDAQGNYTAGKITGMSQGAIIIPSGTNRQAKLYLYDGMICDNEFIENTAAVLVQSNSQMYLYGGMIANNTNKGQLVDGVWTKDYGSGIYVSESTLNMYNGLITGNQSTRGAGIWSVGDGIVNIYGGVISDNVAYHNPANTKEANVELAHDKGMGGAIYLSGGSVLNMLGGQIMNNTAASNGGGIFMINGTVNLLGGKISGNTAFGVEESVTTAQTPAATPSEPSVVDENGEVTGGGNDDITGGGSDTDNETTGSKRIMSGTGYGGGIYLSRVAATIANVQISGNTASHAGAIFITGSSIVDLEDVTMTGNVCHSTGAMALYAEAKSEVTITGGLITDNSSTGRYGNSSSAIYLPNANTVLTLQGAPVIIGNYRKDENNPSYRLERNIYLQNSKYDPNEIPHAQLTLGVLTEGANFTVITQMAPTDEGGIEYCTGLQWLKYSQETAANWDSSYMKYAHYKERAIVAQGDKLVLIRHYSSSHTEGTGTWQPYGGNAAERATLPATSGHYFLTSDIVMTENRNFVQDDVARDVGVMLEGDQQITICLNGYSIEAFSRLYRITGNASVTICDCSGKGQIISGGNYTMGDKEYSINGGVIYVGTNAADVTLKNITVTNKNNRVNSYGALICHSGTGNLTLNNVKVQGMNSVSTATGGGVIYASKCAVTITDSQFENCTSVNAGGVLYMTGNQTLTLTGTTFKNCHSDSNGGALTAVNNGKVQITNCKFENCTGKSGAAICVRNDNANLAITGCEFVNCAATENATVNINAYTLASTGKQTLEVKNSSFQNCTSGESGGALYMASDTDAIIDNVDFISCTVTGANQNGGAICNASKGSFTMTNCDFQSCTAAGNGGAILISKPEAVVNITGSTFTGCTATNCGGAINITSAGTVNITNSQFDNCKVNGNMVDGKVNLENGWGGAIYSAATKLDITNSDFDGNQAVRGGALYSGSKTLNITDGTFTGNTAVQYGAIQIMGGANAVIDGSSITGNASTREIGAINVENNSHLTLIDATITGNNSGNYGAVFVFDGKSSLTIKGKTVIFDNLLGKTLKQSNLFLRTNLILNNGQPQVTSVDEQGVVTNNIVKANSRFILHLQNLDTENAKIGIRLAFDDPNSYEGFQPTDTIKVHASRTAVYGDADYSTCVVDDAGTGTSNPTSMPSGEAYKWVKWLLAFTNPNYKK